MEGVKSFLTCQTSVLEAGKWLAQNGFFGTSLGTGGNVSLRVPPGDILAITPTAKRYHDLVPEEICVVDFAGKRLAGPFRPSIEIDMHLAAYNRRPDIGAVIHTHQEYASVFSLLGHAVPVLLEEVAFKIGRQIDMIPFAPAGSTALADRVREKLTADANGYILQNHGALVLAESMDEALLNVELLEKMCRVYYFALATGKPVSTLP
ncbi:MAG: class II aldolase/adducin family protein [Syntrophobacterales bacterium]|jgi:ribulose-5-phosphate 4-epimerase/fuculose-1-phosphate aldolase|nr:class II aldolase/adducin family protein [Syntrophobacterales bacterium]